MRVPNDWKWVDRPCAKVHDHEIKRWIIRFNIRFSIVHFGLFGTSTCVLLEVYFLFTGPFTFSRTTVHFATHYRLEPAIFTLLDQFRKFQLGLAFYFLRLDKMSNLATRNVWFRHRFLVLFVTTLYEKLTWSIDRSFWTDESKSVCPFGPGQTQIKLWSSSFKSQLFFDSVDFRYFSIIIWTLELAPNHLSNQNLF